MVIFHSYVSLPEGRCSWGWKHLLRKQIKGIQWHQHFVQRDWTNKEASKQAGTEQICNVSNKNQNNANQTHIIPSNTLRMKTLYISMQNPQLQNRNWANAITFQIFQQMCWIRKSFIRCHNQFPRTKNFHAFLSKILQKSVIDLSIVQSPLSSL